MHCKLQRTQNNVTVVCKKHYILYSFFLVAMQNLEKESCAPQLLVITDEAPYLFHRDEATKELKMEKRRVNNKNNIPFLKILAKISCQ